jgi:glyoxylase-like metal-dependent hydrolase (beta-lactamase superfamily II)
MWLDRAGLVAPEQEGVETAWVDIPVYTCLFDHPAGLVLFDTACDPEGMSKNWPDHNKQVSPHEARDDEYLPARLAQLGVSPEDIKYVVLSHLHTDHAGCVKLFKNAEVYVSEREFTEALKQYALRSFGPAYIESDIKGWLDAGLRWKLVGEDVRELKLLDGLTIVNFGSGHTYGMLGLLAELPQSGSFLAVSDALYTKENLGPPVKLPGMLYDREGYLKTAAFIREYAERHRAKILFGHDKDQFSGLKTSASGFYE